LVSLKVPPLRARLSTSSSAANTEFTVDVINAAPRADVANRLILGSGRGLMGLTERVHAASGTFTSGPTAQGGWQISARLPRSTHE
jgi:signal transduction histidine kinase